MAVTVRVGAVHLGWDVVSVAAGGGGSPIRPVQVEGTYTPPAYLLADSSGRLHTAGVDRRPDVGIAISDVRDILGHPQIVVAGATWPADLVFRARLHNPVEAIVKHLGGAPDVIAVPFPDEWPDPKVDEYVRLVELLGYPAEPLPESVALSGYVRALGLVRPAGRGPAVGATGVYSDGRECLVVAVHGDDERPTESVSVPITAEALHDARSADNVVIEVMAAARAIDADTSTILLTGNVCFNDAVRLAFQNHLGHRFQVADHPMHALVLGAAHLLVADYDVAAEHPEPQARHQDPRAAGPGQQGGAPQGGVNPSAVVDQGPRHVPQPPHPAQAQQPSQQHRPEPQGQRPEQPQAQVDSPSSGEPAPGRTPSARPATGAQPVIPASAHDDSETRRITPDDIAQMTAVVAHHTDALRRAAAESGQQPDAAGQASPQAQQAAPAGHAPAPGQAFDAQGHGQPADPTQRVSPGDFAQHAAGAAPADPTQRVTPEDLAKAAAQYAEATRQAAAAGQPADVTRRVTAEDLAQAGAAAQQGVSGQPGVVDSGQSGAAENPGQPSGSRSLPPGLANVGSRFTRPPAKAGSPADDQMTAVMGRPQQQQQQQPGTGSVPGGPQQPGGGSAPGYGAPQGPGTGTYGAVQPGSPGAQPGSGGGYGQAPGSTSPYGAGGGSAPGGYGPTGDAAAGGYGPAGDAAAGGYGPAGGEAGYSTGANPVVGGYGPGMGSGGYGSTGYGSGGSGPAAGYGQGGNSAAGGYGAAPGSEYGAGGGQGGSAGGYGNAGGQGSSGTYPGAGGNYGPGAGGYGAPGAGSGNFAGPGGNAAGQSGSGYGGAMPHTGPRPANSPEDAAGQSDSKSESEGGRKPRKGKIWNKMKDNLFGAPIVVGAAALAGLGMHADDQSLRPASAAGEIGVADSLTGSDIHGIGAQASGLPGFAPAVADASVRPVSFQPASNAAETFDLASAIDQAGPLFAAFGAWPSLERGAVQTGESCAFTPAITGNPHPGIASINDQGVLDCLGHGTGTLRYSVPGPVRGVDPGPPLAI